MNKDARYRVSGSIVRYDGPFAIFTNLTEIGRAVFGLEARKCSVYGCLVSKLGGGRRKL